MAPSRRARRWLLLLSLLAVGLAIAAWWVNRQLEPVRLTTTVLGQAGKSLGLVLRFDGAPEYALKPEPRLLVPNFSVSGSDGIVFLSARSAEISLPWASITGGEAVITRMELDTPILDLPGFRRWQASRPEKPFELPTLTSGLMVGRGTVKDHSFSISDLSLELPRLQSGEPAAVDASGVFTQGSTVASFDLELAADTPGLASHFRLQGRGELRQSPEPLQFQIRAAGDYQFGDAGFAVGADTFEFAGSSPLPPLKGRLRLRFGEQFRLELDGVLARWLEAWPALPEPLASTATNLPISLRYLGKADLSSPLGLGIVREPTRLQASLRVPELRQWLAEPGTTPLPPLLGNFSTDSLVFDGVQLQGVQIEVSPSPTPAATP